MAQGTFVDICLTVAYRTSHIICSSQTCCLFGHISECLGVLTCAKLENTEREDTGERRRIGEQSFKEDAIEVDRFGGLSYGENAEEEDSGEGILGEDLCKEDTFDVDNTEIIFRDNSLDGEGVIEIYPVGGP